LQKAKSASGRTLEHGHKVQWQGPQLVLVSLFLLYLVFPISDGWHLDGHYFLDRMLDLN
jgi:hypothetical protein